MTISAGLDLGRVVDRTVLAIVEETEARTSIVHLDVWRPEHRDLLDVPDRIEAALERFRPALAVDAGGIGRALVPHLVRRIGHLVPIYPVVSTHGWRKAKQRHDKGGAIFAPKAEVLAPLFARLPSGGVNPPRALFCPRDLPGADVLAREFKTFETWTGPDGLRRWGARGRGRHDDTVAALSLAVWLATSLRERAVGGFRPINREKETQWNLDRNPDPW